MSKALVLFTGSKFFRGPPFSGAVFVPKYWMDKLKDIGSPVPKSLNTFIGKNEVPGELTSWRASLEPTSNLGLALRWEAAMAEIQPTLSIPEKERKELTMKWREEVIRMIDQNHDTLNYFSEASDTPSIVSVRVRNPKN